MNPGRDSRVDPGRRRVIGMAGAATVLAVWPALSRAQLRTFDSLVLPYTQGAPLRRGRVKLAFPVLADNGNSVEMDVTVDSPMTQADHVRAIHLLSERNPVKEMASFHLSPRNGRAHIHSRVRLAGSQKVTALAQLSDGSFWYDVAEVIVTLSACVDAS